MTLSADRHSPQQLTAGDAFVLPPHSVSTIGMPSDDLEILDVALPAQSGTFRG